MIAFKVLGTKGKACVDFMIAATQFSFALNFISFISTSVHQYLKVSHGTTIWIWYITFTLWLVLIPIAWVRNISKFSFTFLIGNMCLMFTVITVTAFMILEYRENGFGPGI